MTKHHPNTNHPDQESWPDRSLKTGAGQAFEAEPNPSIEQIEQRRQPPEDDSTQSCGSRTLPSRKTNPTPLREIEAEAEPELVAVVGSHRMHGRELNPAPASGSQASAATVPADRHCRDADRTEKNHLGVREPSLAAGAASSGLLEDLRFAVGEDRKRQASRQDSSFFFPEFDDPAMAVALAVRFACKARRHRIPMAPPVLSLLDFHADQGDASCLAVRAWLARIGLVRVGTCGSRLATDANRLARKNARANEQKVSV